uniref:outer dynein arm-docking complex subunit 4-like n=1 Tax=Myxine glutinosa TaxID=7769 RepID=UPI00359014F4
MSEEELKKESAVPFTVYLAQGNQLALKGDNDRAVERYTMGLQIKQNDLSTLLARSKCYLKMGNTVAALKDAEATLQINKTFLKGELQKAEVLYAMGEFEMALVCFHSGQKLHPKKPAFRLGIQKVQETIDNAVGSLPYFCRKNEGNAQIHEMQAKGGNADKKENSERVQRELLEEFYVDREFLNNLLKNKDLAGSRTQSDKKFEDLIRSGHEYLDLCSEFWRQQKPMYARVENRRVYQQKKSRGRSLDQDPTVYALRSLKDIDYLLRQGKPKQSLKVAQHVMCFVKRTSEAEFPTRNKMLANLHNCIGNALLELGNIDEAMENHEAELALAMEHNMEEFRSRALDNIGRIFAKTGRFAQAAEVMEERLSLVCSDLESIWLHYELGRFYLELKNFSEAQNHAQLSLNEAQIAHESQWLLNAIVLAANIDMKLEDYHSAILNFELSLNEARALRDTEAEEGILKGLKEARDAHALKSKNPFVSDQRGNEAHGMDISLGKGIAEKDEESDDVNTVLKQQVDEDAKPVFNGSSSEIEDKV